MEDRGYLVESRLVDVADHGDGSFGGHGGHRSTVAAADSAHADDANLD